MKPIWELIRKIITTKEFYIGVGIVAASLFFTKHVFDINGVGGFWKVGLLEVIIEILVFAVLYNFQRRDLPLEKQFLFLGAILGILFLIVLPPGQSPDDMNHFRRAYGISEGDIIASKVVNENGAIGSALPVEIKQFESTPSSGAYARVGEWMNAGTSGETVDQAYTNTALYSFVCYLPQVVAIMVGKVLGLPIIGMAYLVEIFNFVMWIVLVFFAIRIIPKFKIIVLFIALLPITLQEATSMAPDALTIGLGIFLISYVLYWAFEKKGVMRKRDLAILYMMAIVIGFCKIVYFPLILLYLVIPAEKFGGKNKKWIHISIIVILTLILNLSWLVVSSGFLMEFNPGVDSKSQVIYIITHPLQYIMTIFRSIIKYSQLWLSNMLGTLIGAFAFHLPDVLFLTSFSIFIILFMQRNETLKMRKNDRLVFLSTFIIIVLLIFTSLYVQWTAVGAELIDGVQGRYFLPILLLLPIAISKTGKRGRRGPIITEKTVLYYGLLVNVVACVTIFAQNL